MIAATLFSGIGAPETAMPHWRWPWHAEIEKFPSAVMAARHPQSVNLGDVAAHDFTDKARSIAVPDVLVFGSPCQSYSVAGKRLGLDDPRGNLALVALGIVDRLKPCWFVFENVPGLLSSSEGRDFGLFLRTVDEIGYSLSWSVLDAQYFGVAQRRERVFAVGYLGDWRYPAAVLLEPEGLCGNHPPCREAGKAVAPTIASRPTGGGGLGTDFDCDGGLIASHDISQPLLAKGNSSHRADAESYVAHALRADGFDASEDGTGRGTPIIPIDLRQASRGEKLTNNRAHGGGGPAGHGVGNEGDPAFTVSERGQAVAFDCKSSGQNGFGVGEVASTMRSMGHSKSHQNGGGHQAVSVGSAVRRLTPRECERLQGFPDGHTAITYRNKPAADGPRYKTLGNSMPVPVMRWILSRIEMVDSLMRSIS